ncbi:MAG: hypothetical protein AB7T06_45270 [Kofleriaceae bacterium]
MLAVSLDGQWAIRRRGRDVALYALGTLGPPKKKMTLADESDALVWVGPPTVLARVSNMHAPVPTRVELISMDLVPVAKLDLDAKLAFAAVTGPRLALVGPDVQGALTKVVVVRTAGTGLGAQPIDVNGVPVEHVIGVAPNQLLFVLRKDAMQLFDAVSSRSIGKPNLPLPPPPRTLGNAHLHAWATHASTPDIFVYRLSDGRPFRHAAGAAINEVISHPGSPVIVLVTPRGPVRLHCQAHTLSLIECPWTPGSDLALVPGATPDDVSLIGIGEDGDAPWRVSVGKPPVR